MKILDELIPKTLIEPFNTWIASQSLAYGWMAHKDAPGRFWHRNYVLPGIVKNHYSPEVVNTELSYENLLLSNTPVAHAAKIVSDTLFNGKSLTRVWVNAQTFGDETSIHRDFPIEFKETAKTVIWYPVREWDKDWGGDVMTLTEDDEIDSAAIIKPGRCVEFSGTSKHTGRPMSRYCNALRIAVAFGMEL
jgi:Rps23 Pro-64 3,4-dihydroxylase Tpa1-like proline 4-hydroxylase